MKKTPPVLPRHAVSTIAMVNGNERKHSKVICDGRVMQWVGFGWVDEGPPSAADRRRLPRVEEAGQGWARLG